MRGTGAVLVTGGTSGIGLGVAERLVRDGRPVALVGRDPDRAAAAAERLREVCASADVLAVSADVCDEASLVEAVARTGEVLGPLDGLVAAAGTLARGSVLDLPAQTFEDVWRTNVGGTWNALRACLPGMLERRHGRIVTIGSVLGSVGVPERAAYAATKGAVAALTRSLALEVAGSGVTANCVAPGPIRTKPSADDAATDAFDANIPLGHWGTPRDVAHAVAPLLAPGSAWITGTTVHVDGGYTAR